MAKFRYTSLELISLCVVSLVEHNGPKHYFLTKISLLNATPPKKTESHSAGIHKEELNAV